MKHANFNISRQFGLNQFALCHFGVNPFGLDQLVLDPFALHQFLGIASPADLRPNLYGVD
jgi:hypothetical protein